MLVKLEGNLDILTSSRLSGDVGLLRVHKKGVRICQRGGQGHGFLHW